MLIKHFAHHPIVKMSADVKWMISKSNLLKDTHGIKYLMGISAESLSKRKWKMIDCKECVEYAHTVMARGEIGVEDINRLAIDRHILKGCDQINTCQKTICIYDPVKVPMDIICNGFSMNEVIKNALNFYEGEGKSSEYIAQRITEVLAEKLRLKQGDFS